MAARYAVTTGNWSGAIWAATSGGAAGSAAVPTNADDVTINKNVTVTIDDTTAVANTVTLSNGTTGADVGAILTCTTATNWKLTIQNGITTVATSNPSNTATYTSSILFDMSAAPTYTGEVVVNAAHGATTAVGNVLLYGNYVWKGASRKRHTTINSALTANSTKSVVVADATGWKVGDVLIFATTSAWNATPRTDLVTIATITAGSGTTATVTWTDGAGTGGAVLYDHASGCPVGNFTSNLIFRPTVNNERSCIIITSIVNQQSMDCYFDNVALGARIGGADYGCYSTQSPGGIIFFSFANAGNNAAARHKGLTNNSFYQYRSGGMGGNYLSGAIPRNWNVFYSTHSGSIGAVMWTNISGKYPAGPDEDYAIFASISGIQQTTGINSGLDYPDIVQRRHKISGIFDSGNNGCAIATNVDVEDCDIWSNYLGITVGFGARVSECRFDSAVFPSATSGSAAINVLPTAYATLTDCEFGGNPTAQQIGVLDKRKVTLVNKNPAANGAALQEVFQYQSTTVPAIQRDTTTINRSTSSMAFTLNSSTAQSYEFPVLAKAGETIRLMLYVRKSSSPAYGASTLPSITVSGLGITPVSATMDAGTAADAWELLTLDATNSGAADGNLTVTLTAQSSTAGAKAYFSGLPCAPFVTRCRHYGYLFNETSPTRTADPLTSASFATADAYTDFTWTWGATSSVALAASSTFQKMFDSHQAKATQNVGSAVALTGAGTAGAPALFAAGNVTTTGYTLNGSGSLALGAHTLTGSLPMSYTYTGGTFSQASTTPSFSGGTLTLPTKITASADFSMTTGAIEFGAAGADWNLSDATFSGTISLATTAGQSVTVAMPIPSGFTIDNTEPGNITVTTPTLSANIEWAGALDGTTVLLYNDSDAGALIDTQTVSGAGGYLWSITLPHADVAVGDTLRLRYGNKAYYADELQGTMTSTGITFVGSMTLHPVYAAWGLDGADYDQANGGPYTMDGPNLQVDIDSGSTTGLKTQIGAWTQYLMTLPAGLDAFYGAWDLLAINQIRQNVDVVDVKIDVPTAGALFEFTDNDVNYYRSDFTYPGNVEAGHGLIAITYNASIFVPPPTIISGESVVTGTLTEFIAAVPSASDNATAVWAKTLP